MIRRIAAQSTSSSFRDGCGRLDTVSAYDLLRWSPLLRVNSCSPYISSSSSSVHSESELSQSRTPETPSDGTALVMEVPVEVTAEPVLEDAAAAVEAKDDPPLGG
jgi:hypothetical protein